MKKSAMPNPKGLFKGSSRKKNPPISTKTCDACNGDGGGTYGPDCMACGGNGVIILLEDFRPCNEQTKKA